MQKILTNTHQKNVSNTFVGRERELGRLRDSLKHAANGRGRFIVICGEAGIGKSTLARYFANEAANKGVTFISVSFNHSLPVDPYAPFLDIIKQLNAKNSSQQAPVETQVKKDLTVRNKSSKDTGTWDMESLYSLQINQGLAQQRILAMILEKGQQKLHIIRFRHLHLAHLTAWKFIHYLCESISEFKILVIATLRLDGKETRQNKGPVYADILQRMNREGLLEKIQLTRFDEKDIREFLQKMFVRRDFSSRFIPLLYDTSSGLPSQVSKCIHIMLEKGLIFKQADVWFHKENLTQDYLAEITRDEEDQLVAEKMVQALSSEHQLLLQYAALISGSFNHTLLSTILKKPRMKVIKDLHFLKENKLLTVDNGEAYQFKNSAIQTIILNQITPEEKSSMHLKIAENIEGLDQIDQHEKTYRLAYHYNQTHDKNSAFLYLLQACKLAVESFAFLEAREFVNQALELSDIFNQKKHHPKIVQLLIWSAWLDRIIGNWNESIHHCTKAFEFCEEAILHKLKSQILIQQGLTYFRLNNWQKAQDCFENCLRDKQNLSPFDLAMVNYGMGIIFFELAKYETACEFFNNAQNLAQKIEAKQLNANIFNNLGAVNNILGNRMNAIALYSKCIPIFKELGDNFGLARIYHNIGMTHADEENWQQANAFYGKSLSVSDVMGLVPLKSITFLNRAFALAHLKKLDEAREYNFKAYRLLKRLQDELGLAEYHKIQGVIEREQKNWSEAQKEFETALNKFRVLKNKLGLAECQYELGVLARARSNPEDTIKWFATALESYRELGIPERVKIIEEQLEQIKT